MALILKKAAFGDPLEDLEPLLACEETETGWRGLTKSGEVLDVKSASGERARIPEEIIITRHGEPVARRQVPEPEPRIVTEYLRNYDLATLLIRQSEFEGALARSNAALSIAPTDGARFNRAFAFLHLGRWSEGFDDLVHAERHCDRFMRPMHRAAVARGLRPWNGEDLGGARLLLLDDHGFGDTIMMLRYVPALRAMGAEPLIVCRVELARLASQLAPVISAIVEADYFCSFLHLLRFMRDEIPEPPYLQVDEPASDLPGDMRRIGLAWSVGVPHDDDYPREVPLELLVKAFGPDVDLHSVQVQGADEAADHGVITHEFADFAECAALMMQMDEIVSIDTAALHLAGAIGHPHVTALLSHWHSWRWNAPWYPRIKLAVQTSPGDWGSALAQC
jgi:antitoxin (DNA-binding transcriptional repressor) of toxin-antitoxin stability system